MFLPEGLKDLSDFADFLYLFFVDNLDFPSVDGNELLGGEIGQGADGV
jgi:hypothetical protein